MRDFLQLKIIRRGISEVSSKMYDNKQGTIRVLEPQTKTWIHRKHPTLLLFVVFATWIFHSANSWKSKTRVFALEQKLHMLFNTSTAVLAYNFIIPIFFFLFFPELLNNPILVTKGVQSGMPYRDTTNPVHHRPHSHLSEAQSG